MAAPLFFPRFRAFDQAGAPLAGGKLHAYVATTSTPQDTYTDATLAVPNANPVILDANGEASVWIGANSYKFVLTDANDVVQWTVDSVTEDGVSGTTPVGTFQPVAVFFDAGNTGTALSIVWANGQQQQFTLTDNATVTLGNPSLPGWYTLKAIQDATGGRTLALAGAQYSASRWIGNSAAPVTPGIASSVTMYDLFWDGSKWYQVHLGTAARRNTYTTKVYVTGSPTYTTLQTLPFNNVSSDPYSEWDVVTNFRWTPKVTGLYLVHLQINTYGSAANSLEADIAVANSAVSSAYIAPVVVNTQYTLTAVALVNVTALSQFVSAKISAGAGTGTINNGATTSFMEVARIGDAE